MRCLWLLVGLLVAPVQAVVLGDYDAEPRRADGHVDAEALLRRLGDLHANTYQWLIWHQATDWEDLQAFLPRAKTAGIQVWAYLVPPTESGPHGANTWPYSEPYRLDYQRWATEIARLSLRHDNLVGYVIDDFWANFRPGSFTPESIKAMVAAGKAINPKLRFYPLMYFGEFGKRFADELAPLVDGVVAAYPRDAAELEHALAVLNDDLAWPPGLVVEFPADTPSSPGDRGGVSQRATVTDAAHARLKLHAADDYDGPTTGYHQLEVRVDDRVVWSGDTGGPAAPDADVDLSEAVRGKAEVTLWVGVRDAKGVAQYPVTVSFSKLSVAGLKLAEEGLSSDAWHEAHQGAFALRRERGGGGQHRFRVPLIVMPAGSRTEFTFRYKIPATPEAIADKIRLALGFGERIEGVVIYCLDKSPQSADLDAAAKAFAEQAGR